MKKAVVIGLVALLVLGACAGLTTFFLLRSNTSAKSPKTSLGRFDSAAAFVQAYRKGLSYGRGGAEDGVMLKSAAPTGAAPQSAGTTGAAPEHSNTNVQVAGVDEADIVKNDGNYIYAISGNTVFLVAAYPAQQARIVSRIDFAQGGSLDEMFVSGNRLVVIGGAGYTQPQGGQSGLPRGDGSFMRIYDITDRARPVLARNVQYEGSYSTARLIGQDLHVVLTSTPYYALYNRKDFKASDIIPRVSDTTGAAPAKFVPAVGYRDVQVVDPKQFTSFLSVVSLSLEGGNPVLDKRVVAGYSDNVFASTDNLYVASTEYQYYGMWPESNQQERTTVYKFKFKGPSTAFVASAEVPGTILNQFSMDEANGFFRIATTRGYVSREGSDATNNVYVLDPAMKMSGRLEGLAPGEKIYSARFLGNRAYLVTFKKVDPLFVLDLADPTAPRVLGQLKIPGFSDYLHPYDETHVIGVGKNTVEASPEEGGNFAWYQGLKIAIFDVSDVANPKEMHKVEVGDRGTDSYALNDHKAFLFDREKNLLVLPVLLAELTPEQKASPAHQANDYGKYTYQGAYVYDVTLTGGFQLKGRITHVGDAAKLNAEYGYYEASDAVRRSLWIGDNLYTFSDSKIKANRLSDLGEVATVNLQ